MHFTLDQRNLDSKIIEMYLTNHLGKSVCNKRFIRTLKSTNTWLQYPKICILIN